MPVPVKHLSARGNEPFEAREGSAAEESRPRPPVIMKQYIQPPAPRARMFVVPERNSLHCECVVRPQRRAARRLRALRPPLFW